MVLKSINYTVGQSNSQIIVFPLNLQVCDYTGPGIGK